MPWSVHYFVLKYSCTSTTESFEKDLVPWHYRPNNRSTSCKIRKDTGLAFPNQNIIYSFPVQHNAGGDDLPNLIDIVVNSLKLKNVKLPHQVNEFHVSRTIQKWAECSWALIAPYGSTTVILGQASLTLIHRSPTCKSSPSGQDTTSLGESQAWWFLWIFTKITLTAQQNPLFL